MATAKGASSGKKPTKKTQTISGGSGQQPVTFKKGALHRQLSVPPDQPIPAAKMRAAQRGDYGPTAQKRANFAQGMLAAGRQTAAKNAKKGK